jgi:16S rRNA (guanine(966)-N(2))-methyltransferase RsmD
MRITGGRLGGRRLKAPPGRRTRPTADRVREAVFAMLGELEDAVVLDLFAGSGALGIEALSRGAARAVFVERDAAAATVLRENLEALDLLASGSKVRREDVAAALERARRRHEKYDLVLIDPPYGQAPRWGPELSAALPPLLARDGRVVVESERRAPLQLELPVQRHKVYGDTSITIHLP